MKSFILIVILALTSCSSKQDPTVSYFPQVKSIIETQCITCHSVEGTGTPKGLPVLLETDAQIVALAQKIKQVTSDPVTVTNKRMPYNSELSQSQKDVIIKWVVAGGTASN